jgi:arsenate reductase
MTSSLLAKSTLRAKARHKSVDSGIIGRCLYNRVLVVSSAVGIQYNKGGIKDSPMSEFLIFHNPRCSKSRQTLQLLQQQGIEPDIRLYLEQPPSDLELRGLLQKLNIEPRALLRRSETDYKEQNLSDATLGDDALVRAMVQFPKLIERPIVIRGSRAVLGRPPENVLDLLDA